jgi:hypothetical protein
MGDRRQGDHDAASGTAPEDRLNTAAVGQHGLLAGRGGDAPAITGPARLGAGRPGRRAQPRDGSSASSSPQAPATKVSATIMWNRPAPVSSVP